MTTKVSKLLRSYISLLPERRQKLLERSPTAKEEYTSFKVDPPESPVAVLQTIDKKVTRALSPQLRDWYAISGTLIENSWKYLSPAEIRATVKGVRLKAIVASHREYWDESAPMKFVDSQLSVFAVINNLDDGDLIYFVWPTTDSAEPELWEYFGQSETRYEDLGAYLEKILEV